MNGGFKRGDVLTAEGLNALVQAIRGLRDVAAGGGVVRRVCRRRRCFDVAGEVGWGFDAAGERVAAMVEVLWQVGGQVQLLEPDEGARFGDEGPGTVVFKWSYKDLKPDDFGYARELVGGAVHAEVGDTPAGAHDSLYQYETGETTGYWVFGGLVDGMVAGPAGWGVTERCLLPQGPMVALKARNGSSAANEYMGSLAVLPARQLQVVQTQRVWLRGPDGSLNPLGFSERCAFRARLDKDGQMHFGGWCLPNGNKDEEF